MYGGDTVTLSGSEQSWRGRARWLFHLSLARLFSGSFLSEGMTGYLMKISLKRGDKVWSNFSTKWLVTLWPRTSDACTCFYRRSLWTRTTPHPKSDKPDRRKWLCLAWPGPALLSPVGPTSQSSLHCSRFLSDNKRFNDNPHSPMPQNNIIHCLFLFN